MGETAPLNTYSEKPFERTVLRDQVNGADFVDHKLSGSCALTKTTSAPHLVTAIRIARFSSYY